MQGVEPRLNRLLLATATPDVTFPVRLADRCHPGSETVVDRQERTIPTSMQALRERECSQDGQHYSRDDDELDCRTPEDHYPTDDHKEDQPCGFGIWRGGLGDEHLFAPRRLLAAIWGRGGAFRQVGGVVVSVTQACMLNSTTGPLALLTGPVRGTVDALPSAVLYVWLVSRFLASKNVVAM